MYALLDKDERGERGASFFSRGERKERKGGKEKEEEERERIHANSGIDAGVKGGRFGSWKFQSRFEGLERSFLDIDFPSHGASLYSLFLG